jgi:hypothetical protein
LTYENFKNSQFYNALKGLGNTVYVSRDDFSKLTSNIHEDFRITGIIEKPDALDKDIIDKFLNQIAKVEPILLEDFIKNKQQATYNKDDIAPTKILKEFQKHYTKEDTKDHWHLILGTLAEAEGSFLGAGGKGKLKLDYNNEGLHDILKENDIEANTEGITIVPKSIDLYQVNLTDTSNTKTLISDIQYSAKAIKNKFSISTSLSYFGRDCSPVEYDVIRQFSSESEIWQYGYTPKDSVTTKTSFKPYPNHVVNENNSGLEIFNAPIDRITDPSLIHTLGDKPISLAQNALVAVPDKLILHPGANGEFSVLRWVAPTSGNYRFDISVEAANKQIQEPNTKLLIYKFSGNTCEQFKGVILPGKPGTSRQITFQKQVQSQDIVDFMIGLQDKYGSNSTYLTVKITNVCD